MDLQQTQPRTPGGIVPATGMAFLSENPEAFGFVADAYPLAVGDLLIAADGHSVEAGAISPTYPAEAAGAAGMLETVYGGMLTEAPVYAHLLQNTFGECQVGDEFPIARYAAALAEASAVSVLCGPARGASREQTALLLGDALARALHGLSRRLTLPGEAAPEADLFRVSMGICRVISRGEGNYTLDIFNPGDFGVFLLDGHGMRPLMTTPAAPFSPDTPGDLPGVTLELDHPEPFALLLLSNSVFSVSPAEARRIAERPALLWRHRMRLEESFLRILTDCVREQEFGERATRYFTGRVGGRDSTSGAMTILRGETSFESFRSLCRGRLSDLEHTIALLPDGYEPAETPPVTSRLDVEEAYIRRLLEREVGLGPRVSEALRMCALETHAAGPDVPLPPPPEDAPDFRRLRWDELQEIFRVYDQENDEDRDRIAANNRLLRQSFADHWITLRPALASLCLSSDDRSSNDRSSDDPALADFAAESDRLYAACLGQNAQLGRWRSERMNALSRLEDLLSRNLEVLKSEGADWVGAASGDDRMVAVSEDLSRELPGTLDDLLRCQEETTAAYRRLLADYTAGREQLFVRDAETPTGFFAAAWRNICEGNLSEERWNHLRQTLESAGRSERYLDLFDSLCRISKGTGVLRRRINDREAPARMARDVANRTEWQLACLRAAAYEDTAFGSGVCRLLTAAQRADYHAAIRRWQESCDLLNQRAAAFDTYRRMYEND